MAFELTRSFSGTATAAIAERRFVVVGATGVTQATAGATAVGVSAQTAAAAGDVINVYHISSVRVEVEAGAGVLAGAVIASDAQGRAITGTGAVAQLGYAETAAAAAGEYITVLLAPKPANVT